MSPSLRLGLCRGRARGRSAGGGGATGSTRSTAAPCSPEVGRAGRAVVVVTAQPTAGTVLDPRAGRDPLVPRAGAVDERVQLELHAGRSPPQGAVLDALVVVHASARARRTDSTSAAGSATAASMSSCKVDEWTQIGRRGGLGGLADRLRAWLERSIAPGLGGERRAVLEGIVLGDELAALAGAEARLPGVRAVPHPGGVGPERRAGRGRRAPARVAPRRRADGSASSARSRRSARTCSRSARRRR